MSRTRWMWAGALGLVTALVVVGLLLVLPGDPDLSSGVDPSEPLLAPDLPPWEPPTAEASDTSIVTSVGSPDDSSFAVASGAQLPQEEFDVTFFVDPVAGRDGNPGRDEDTALRTIGYALLHASEARRSGDAVRVVLMPGVYREGFGLRQDPEDSPLLVVEPAEPGTAIVSGADTWTDWEWSEEDQAFVHEWPFDWEPASGVEEIVGRRELVAVGGVLLDQVLKLSALTDGAFFVDPEADRLYMRPPSGSEFPGLAAEVGVRELLMNLDSARNVVIRGLTFQHAPSPFESNAVRISNSRDVLFESNRVVDNGWTGLGVSTSSRLTIRNNELNSNGGGGAGIFKTEDVVFEGNDTSLNNWRGVRGDYVGWSIAGVKAVGVHQLAIRGHRAWGNATRGLWLDFDVVDISIEDSSWCHNLTDGLFLEAAPGPITVRRIQACENQRHGILLVNVYGVTLSESVVCGNGDAAIHMDAEPGGRSVTTDGGVLQMSAALDLTVRSSVFAGKGPLLRLSIPREDFTALLPTMTFEANEWLLTSNRRAFEFPGGGGDIAEWRRASGQDSESGWDPAAPAIDCETLQR